MVPVVEGKKDVRVSGAEMGATTEVGDKRIIGVSVED